MIHVCVKWEYSFFPTRLLGAARLTRQTFFFFTVCGDELIKRCACEYGSDLQLPPSCIRIKNWHNPFHAPFSNPPLPPRHLRFIPSLKWGGCFLFFFLWSADRTVEKAYRKKKKKRKKKNMGKKVVSNCSVSNITFFLSSNPPPPLSSITQGNIKAQSLGRLSRSCTSCPGNRKRYQDSPPAFCTCVSRGLVLLLTHSLPLPFVFGGRRGMDLC